MISSDYTMPTRTEEIRFFINGDEHKVSKVTAKTSLNDYLRETAGLKGTKVMCREAGCGCCSVTVSYLSPDSGKMDTFSVQSCLTPLLSVDGWQITTIEGLGSQRTGFHPLQERIAKFNGSQCGYCTPGMVMNMYGLLHQKPDITAQDVEDNFDGNICRCTGYRPILDAMKSFAMDSKIPGNKAIDIEDLNKKLCPKTGEVCTGDHDGKGGTRNLDIQVNGTRWFRPTSLGELGSVLQSQKDQSVRLLFGNTGSGIYKDEGPFDVYVDLHQVKELFSHKVTEDTARFGACTSLTSLMSKLKDSQDKPGFKYFTAIVRHLKFVANVMVRNAGSIAGNLMTKHKYPDFPSDIFTMLEAAGAHVELYDSSTNKLSLHTLVEFLRQVDMKGKVLTAVILQKFADNVVYKSFKITPRWQNAHAYVNAAFKVATEERRLKGRPSIVFGGISAATVHATNTEKFLENKELSLPVVKEAVKTLLEELDPNVGVLLSSPKYRKELAGSLLYKVLLGIYNTNEPKLKSGPDNLHRPISKGLQTYQEMKSEFPLKEPMTKKTAPLQASGEAQFITDIPTFQHEVFGAFVLSEQSVAKLESIDASEALQMPGVVTFLSAKDIPEGGDNNYMNKINPLMGFMPQELFVTKDISFTGQNLGMIVAGTQSQAIAAAKKVKVNYTDIQKPILTIEESIAAGKETPYPKPEIIWGEPDDAWKSVDRTLEGECSMGSQYHFFLEPHVSLSVPNEDGIDVYAATQFAQMNQIVAAEVIGKPLNFINMTVPRVGGGFGGKAWDSCSMTAASTLAAYLLGRPCRVAVDLSTMMRLCGKRAPIMAKYKVGFQENGDIKVIEMDFYQDCGYTPNSWNDLAHTMHYLDMGYFVPNWKIKPHAMFTNKQCMSPTRSPGAVPAALVMETIMEHVSKAVNQHPIIVKELNLYEKNQVDLEGHQLTHCTMRDVWRRLKELAEVETRRKRVDAYNLVNLWKKRGITMTASKYGINHFGFGFTCNVTIFAQDGSVQVSQGGVELGQGLYTKVAQAVAHSLRCPVDNIKVRPNQGIISPNSWVTGGSSASELAMMAAIGACDILKERMQPIREKNPDADWKDFIQKCHADKVDLSAKFMNRSVAGKPHFNYFTYSAAAVETEVDILTGESQILRVDIMCDFGESLNPIIDIGQVEGAFTMGLGLYLSEDIKFDGTTGRILNDGTWEYKPPTTKDIPIDWRVHLLPDTPNPSGILSSKAVGEPPISLSVGALLANKLAVEAARKDLFGVDDFVKTVSPFTVERAQQSVGITLDSLKL